jgi:hypothetical protein
MGTVEAAKAIREQRIAAVAERLSADVKISIRAEQYAVGTAWRFPLGSERRDFWMRVAQVASEIRAHDHTDSEEG